MASIILIASEILQSRNINTTLYTFVERDNKNHSYNMCITSSFATELEIISAYKFLPVYCY